MRHTSLPLQQLASWSRLNNAELWSSSVSSNVVSADGLDKGGGLVAAESLAENELVLKVPRDLVLNRDKVEELAKIDHHLRQVLDVGGEYFQSSRKSITIFLLMQMIHNSPDFSAQQIGVNNAFTDYVKFLPKDILLPTFYTAKERELLIGTSLYAALNQKTSSLEDEFERFKSCTQKISWCADAWWEEGNEKLTLEDWKLADAIYRSRAIDIPKDVGHSMVPLVDMANHAPDDWYNARFDVGSDGEIVLLVKEGCSVKEREEITINYGPGGACESIFSYGFLPPTASTAREIYLDLSIPLDDPLRLAKSYVAGEAPSVRLYVDDKDRIQWDSDIVWWACVNEEDGLDFRLAQTVDGGRELTAFWQDEKFEPSQLEDKLLAHPKRDVFLLRATIIVQQRVEAQGEELSAAHDAFGGAGGLTEPPQIRQTVYDTIRHLRRLELDLLTTSYKALDAQRNELLKSRTVSEYLSSAAIGSRQSEGNQEEDFS